MHFEIRSARAVAIQAGNADHSGQPANGQHHQREHNPGLQLRNLEAIAESVGDGETWRKRLSGWIDAFAVAQLWLLQPSRLQPWLHDVRTLAAFGFDLRLGRGAECMGANGQLSCQFTVAENLDASALCHWPGQRCAERLIHARAVFELIQRFQIHRDVTRGMARVVETALGDAANERHLTTFETDADRAAGAGGLAFATATAGFAVTAGFTLAEPLAAVLGARTRF